MGSIDERFNEVGVKGAIPANFTLIHNQAQDLNNFKHLKHHLGLLSIEKRLLKHYGVMDTVG